MGRSAIVALAALAQLGCASVIASTPLPPGNYRLEVSGHGSRASAEIKCLRPEVVRQLTGGEIPGYAPKLPCYTVVILAGSSAAISRAVTAYANAERELFSKVEKQSPEATPTSAEDTEEEAAIRQKYFKNSTAVFQYYKDAADTFFLDAVVLDKAKVKGQATTFGIELSVDEAQGVSKLLAKKAQSLKKVGIDAAVVEKLNTASTALETAAATK